jgi:hypothetical protein
MTVDEILDQRSNLEQDMLGPGLIVAQLVFSADPLRRAGYYGRSDVEVAKA